MQRGEWQGEGEGFTFVMDVNTFSRTALGWALRTVSAWICTMAAHGPAMNLTYTQTNTHAHKHIFTETQGAGEQEKNWV